MASVEPASVHRNGEYLFMLPLTAAAALLYTAHRETESGSPNPNQDDHFSSHFSVVISGKCT